ncbi:MAG: hypothetical protein WA971_02045, partial [Microbacterium sp.]
MRDPRGLVLASAVWASALLAVFLPTLVIPLTIAVLLGAVLAVLRGGRFRAGFTVIVLLACAATGVVVATTQPARSAAA